MRVTNQISLLGLHTQHLVRHKLLLSRNISEEKSGSDVLQRNELNGRQPFHWRLETVGLGHVLAEVRVAAVSAYLALEAERHVATVLLWLLRRFGLSKKGTCLMCAFQRH